MEPFFSLFLQLREWDLWQMTHSYVDVYFPRRAIAEAELGLLPFRLPPGTSHRMGQVKRTCSCSCTHDLSAEHAPPCSHITISKAGAPWDVVSPSNATFHARYHPLDEIQSFVRDLAAAYPKQVTIVPLGHSGEGREMFALEISAAFESAGASGAQASAGHGSHDQNPQVVLDGKGKERGTNPRCGFLITGAQHAREVSLRLFVLLGLRNGIHLCSLSGLLLLPRCTSHTPSWLTRQRSFLSPVYSSDMYVCQFVARRSMLMKSTEFLYCSCYEPRWICIYMGKRPILVLLSHYLSSYLWLNFIAGTKIACSLVLKLVA
jgi:hypothetical protein